MLKENVALSVLGYPEQIASLSVFLASSISNFKTGSVWIVDGGQVH